MSRCRHQSGICSSCSWLCLGLVGVGYNLYTQLEANPQSGSDNNSAGPPRPARTPVDNAGELKGGRGDHRRNPRHEVARGVFRSR